MNGSPSVAIEIAGIPVEFVLFGLTLLGVALFHKWVLPIALAGAAAITAYKLAFTGFSTGAGVKGLAGHLQHEWATLANLLGLLSGFALLSRHFEKSHFPLLLPRFLPAGWLGAFGMLAAVFVLSGFLDNIAAALIGGAMAHQLFRARVHLAYLVAIVAAANAGGAGSVLGDTTTTMLWLAGVQPLQVLHAYLAAAVALVICGIPASIQQQRLSPMLARVHSHVAIDWARAGIVALILASTVAANVMVNLYLPASADRYPVIGVAVWMAIVVSLPWRRPDWEVLPEALRGALFLLSLVLCASMMPVDRLPVPSAQSAFGIGVVSAVFDNIPLTALAIRQGGYDWGFLAYAVGFGGSMVWFGSSAGVALANQYPESKSVWLWIRQGWPVALAYLAGFLAMLLILGWNPAAIPAAK